MVVTASPAGAQMPADSGLATAGLQSPRADPPHVPSLGAHAPGQVRRLPGYVHRAAAGLSTSTSNSRCRSRKADTHRFTLYRSDFLPGTNLFSPSGASRFNIMSTRIPGWMGPITVEWTPDQPALAEQRRQAVLETMQRAGQPLLADRVVIGPSPYPGAMGVEAVNNNGNAILRNQGAASVFPLPPTETAATGVH